MIALAVAGVLAGTTGASAQVVAAPVVAVPALTQAVYLATVKQVGAGTTIVDQSDAAMIASGKSLCASIADGATRASFAKQVYDYGIDARVFRALLEASVLTYCPASADIL